MSLQLSPLELIRNINGLQGNSGIRMARDPLRLSTAHNCTGSQGRSNVDHKSVVGQSTSTLGRGQELDLRTRQVAFNSMSSEESLSSASDISNSRDSSTHFSAEEEEEGARTLANLLANVDFTDVKNSWTRRVHMPRTRKPKSLLHTMQLLRKENAATVTLKKSFDSLESLQSIPECADVPEVTRCDSLLSFTSDFSSFSTRGSTSRSYCNVTPRKINFNKSSQRNTEWEIIE